MDSIAIYTKNCGLFKFRENRVLRWEGNNIRKHGLYFVVIKTNPKSVL